MKNMVRKVLKGLLVITIALSTLVQFPIRIFAKEKDATIYLNSDNIVTNNFEGFGVQWDPSDLFDYTDEQWNSFVEKATFLKPNIMRVMLHDADSYCIGFDENNKPIYDFDSIMMKRVYRILDFAEKENIPIMLGEWVGPKDRGFLTYTEHGKTVGWDSQTWADMIVDVLDHLVNVKGYTCIRYYNMINEPNHKKANNTMQYPELYSYWTRGVDNLRKTMDATNDQKVEKIKIVGPDVYTDWNGWLDQTTAAPTKDNIDINEIHWYAPSGDVASGKVEETLRRLRTETEAKDPEAKNEGFGVGEMGVAIGGGGGQGDQQLRVRNYDYGVQMFDYAVQCMRSGMKFASAWGFEDGMHIQDKDVVTTYKDQYGPEAKTEEGKKYKVHTTTGQVKIDNNLKVWGFWNELGEEVAAQNAAAPYVSGGHNSIKASDEQIRPWYYTWSMICRYFPEGAQVVSASKSNVDKLRASAAIIPSSQNKNDISIAAVNASSEEKTVVLAMPNATTPTDLTQYLYYDGEIDGQTRPQTSKSEVLPYKTLKNCDLSKGVEVTLPANSALVLTTLGYEGERNPVSMTTGEKPNAQFIEVSAESEVVELNKPMKMSAVVEPEGADSQIDWSVTDYFGKPTDKAIITADGIMTMSKVGEIKVVAKSKSNPSATGSMDIRGTKAALVIDKLQDIDSNTVAEYQNIIVDDNSSNFGGIKTIKRSDSNAAGKSGIITYQANGIYKAKFGAYATKTDLDTSGNFIIEVSKNKIDWSPVALTATKKPIGNWNAYEFETKNIDKSQDYQYLRVTLKSLKGYKTYEPQYSGCEISFGEQSVSNITIGSERQVLAKNTQLQFNAKVEPADFSQEVKWDVYDSLGASTSLATISQSGLLEAKGTGEVIVSVTTKDGDMSAYQTIDIVNGYFTDDISDFSKMYQYGDFAFEKADVKKFVDTTVIKRLTNTNQSLVYALPDIEKAEFEVYKNGSLDSASVDIYTSQDGIQYKKIEKTIKDMGKSVPNSEYTKFKVSSKNIDKDTHFVKFEVKNDESVFCPLIGKTEIIYNQDSDNKIVNLSIDQKSLSVHMGEEESLNLKVAPLTSNQNISWESEDENIATVDSSGKVTGKKMGSTIVYAKYNDDIYASSVVNVLTTNLALKKDTRASTETNEWQKNPTKSFANDGDINTRWVSKNGPGITKEYLEVDLGEEQVVDNVKIFWEAARAKDFNIEVSLDGVNYTVVKEIRGSDKLILTDDISFSATKARFVRMQGLATIDKYGYSIFEFRIYNNTELKNVESLAFDNLLEQLYLGEKTPLNTKVTPVDAVYQDITYQSSDDNVVTIHHNQLLAVGIGKATITATLDGKVISQEITVVEENSRKIATLIDNIEIKGNQLVLPQYEGYTINVASSDVEKIIGKDGIIHQPVKTTKIKVVLNVVEKTKARNAIQGASTNPIEIVIAGMDTKYKELITLIADVRLIKESEYTNESVQALKTQLTNAYQTLIIENLLVSEIEEAYSNLQKTYTSLQKNIIVEVDPDKPGEKPDGNQDQPNNDKSNENQNQSNDNVKTSDIYNVLGCIVIVILSFTVIIISYNKKRNKGQ